MDLPAGVLPITKVDQLQDRMSQDELLRMKKLNSVAAGAYEMYDSVAMHGLPVGVQIVGPRLEEEKVLEGMKVIENALAANELSYISGL